MSLIFYWLKVDANWINAFVHDIDPTFSCRYLKQGRHSLENIIEILICINPFSSCIEAIEFGLNKTLWIIDHLIGELFSKDTGKKCALEIIHSDDTAYQKEHQWNDHYVEEAWNSHDQSLDANFETFVSANDSQRPKDTKKPEDLDYLHFAARDSHLDDWDDNNDEIDNIPSNSQVAVLAIEKKAEA